MPVVIGDGEERPTRRMPGVVHHGVDAAVASQGCIDQALEVRRVGHRARDRKGVELPGQGSELLPAGEQRQTIAPLRQGPKSGEQDDKRPQ
jgi:hypothetical protein